MSVITNEMIRPGCRDRNFNIGSLVANLEVALKALAKHIQRASKP